MKSEHFGEGLERSASSGTGRFTVLVLIALLAAILLWLIGTAAERTGLHERLRPCSGKRRAYSRLFLARLLLTVEHCKAAGVDLADAIGPLDQWVASAHAALLCRLTPGGRICGDISGTDRFPRCPFPNAVASPSGYHRLCAGQGINLERAVNACAS